MKKYTDIIDRFLRDEMSPDEKRDFLNQLKLNAELRAEFELQSKLVKGLDQVRIKTELKKGMKAASFNSKLKWGFGGVLITGSLVALLIGGNRILNKDKHLAYPLNENGSKLWADADKNLPSQVYKVNNTRDTILETKSGIILTVPARTFLHGSDTVEKDIDLEIKEAMNASDIMKAGLSTITADGQLLETGGMFYINARRNGENLSIAKNKGIYSSIPNLNPTKNMQLFKGSRGHDGGIVWEDPKPFEKPLRPVDILKLNFYPPGFLDTLNQMGWDISNKKCTDSIYYSFVSPCNGGSVEHFIGESADSSYTQRGLPVLYSRHCEVDPSRIRAIWDKKFNNTLLATKEFEERLIAIFRSCNQKILEVYTKHLDKKMYQLDSMASILNREGGERGTTFHDFYMRRDGGVSINANHLEKLHSYLEEKQNLYMESAKKAMEKLKTEDRQFMEEYWQKTFASQEKETRRRSDVLQGEIELNMDEAYRQLGKKRPERLPAPENYLGTTIVNTGWYNVDAYVVQSTVNRKTLDYTDPATGKKAVIKYQPLEVKVENASEFEKVYAYLLPKQLSSFQKINGEKGHFNEKLNELLEYDLILVGYKGEKQFGAFAKDVKPGNKNISLRKMSNGEIERLASINRTAGKDIFGDLFEIDRQEKLEKSREVITKREDVKTRLMPVVFPCYQVPPQAQPETGYP